MKLNRNGETSSIRLPTDSWYGSRNTDQLYHMRTFRFPSSWDVQIFEADGADVMRPLNSAEIAEGVKAGIGTEPLRDLAEGCKTATVIVDDLSRPTPSYAIVPHILEEIEAAGVHSDGITFIVGVGTHRPLTRAEQRRKLGREVVERYRVVNHNSFSRRMTRYQRTWGGPDFKINSIVAQADLKISVSCIIPHPGAGFGGGAKAILPSVASYDSIRFNHSTYKWEGKGIIYPREITSDGIRREMELCARAVGLDYSVNIVVSPLKEPVGVFSGDCIEAHRKGCRLATELYLTDVPETQLDLVIANSFPMDTDLGQSFRGAWPQDYGKQNVLIGGARDGWAYHGDGGKSYAQNQKMKKGQKPLDAYRFKAAEGNDERGLYYSPTVSPDSYYSREGQRQLFQDWDELTSVLNGDGRTMTVGVFPYASLQMEKAR